MGDRSFRVSFSPQRHGILGDVAVIEGQRKSRMVADAEAELVLDGVLDGHPDRLTNPAGINPDTCGNGIKWYMVGTYDLFHCEGNRVYADIPAYQQAVT